MFLSDLNVNNIHENIYKDSLLSFLEAVEGPGQLGTSYSLIFKVDFCDSFNVCIDKVYVFYFKIPKSQ